MTAVGSRRRRQVVPRWRPWRTTASLGELAHPGSGRSAAPPGSGWTQQQQEFLSQPSRGRAADLLASAVVLDIDPEQVPAQAKQLASGRPGLLLDLAAHVDDVRQQRLDRAENLDEPSDPAQRIATLRGVVRREPRNTVRWVDLGLAYAAVGRHDKAAGALRVARNLAPHDRFVLRSSAALLAEHDGLDEAAAVLTAGSTDDPWILAALIAVTDLGDRRVQGVRAATQLLDRHQGPPNKALAELAAAVASVEYGAGADRRARRRLRSALLEPTDNAFAQAVCSPTAPPSTLRGWMRRRSRAATRPRPGRPPRSCAGATLRRRRSCGRSISRSAPAPPRSARGSPARPMTGSWLAAWPKPATACTPATP